MHATLSSKILSMVLLMAVENEWMVFPASERVAGKA